MRDSLPPGSGTALSDEVRRAHRRRELWLSAVGWLTLEPVRRWFSRFLLRRMSR